MYPTDSLSAMPAHDPAFTYAVQMTPQGRGYALFNPEPLRRGRERVRDPCVDIGDVGYVSEGSFHLLFNIHRAQDDPLQIHGVPGGFQRLERREALIEYQPRDCPRVMHSGERSATELGAGVTIDGLGGASMSWSLERERGATLAYFDKHEIWNAQNKESYKRYFRTHYKSWVEFLRSLDIDRSLKDLILVTGCDRTRAWATMLCESRATDARVSLEVQTTVGPHISLTGSVKWRTSHTFPALSGPSAAELSSSAAQALSTSPSDNTSPYTGFPDVVADQCMFIRGWQGRGLFGIAELKAGAGPHVVPSADEQDDDDRPRVDADIHDSDEADDVMEEVLGSPANTSETVLSSALKIIADRYAPCCDDDILLMHDDELALHLPNPANAEWDSVEKARSYLEDHFRVSPPESLEWTGTSWVQRDKDDEPGIDYVEDTPAPGLT
ncbi:hypothetical protein PENSPDRAFT_757255 [Peniophora sp. CONT]|nr:hypothetical protein PENSPDRAFT_757255 [Peniophora sp. CONT]